MIPLAATVRVTQSSPVRGRRWRRDRGGPDRADSYGRRSARRWVQLPNLPQHLAHPLGSVKSRGQEGVRCQPSAETM